MERLIGLHRAGGERIAVLERKHRLVFGAMVLIHAANVAKQGSRPDEK